MLVLIQEPDKTCKNEHFLFHLDARHSVIQPILTPVVTGVCKVGGHYAVARPARHKTTITPLAL